MSLGKKKVWYTRFWWIVFHGGNYAWLVYSGTWEAYFEKRPSTPTIRTSTSCALLGLGNFFTYVALQCSNPGFVPLEMKDEELAAKTASNIRDNDVALSCATCNHDGEPREAAASSAFFSSSPELFDVVCDNDDVVASTSRDTDVLLMERGGAATEAQPPRCASSGKALHYCSHCSLYQPLRSKHWYENNNE
jgi:hypothetical protein